MVKFFAILLYGIVLLLRLIFGIITGILDTIMYIIQKICDRLEQFIYPNNLKIKRG